MSDFTSDNAMMLGAIAVLVFAFVACLVVLISWIRDLSERIDALEHGRHNMRPVVPLIIASGDEPNSPAPQSPNHFSAWAAERAA